MPRLPVPLVIPAELLLGQSRAKLAMADDFEQRAKRLRIEAAEEQRQAAAQRQKAVA